MVVLFVGCGCVAETRKTYYSYVENLRRDSFCSRRNANSSKAVNCAWEIPILGASCINTSAGTHFGRKGEFILT